MNGYSIEYSLHHNNYLHFFRSLDEVKNFIKSLNKKYGTVPYKIYRAKKHCI